MIRDEHGRIANRDCLGQRGSSTQSTERMFLPARTMAASRCSGEGVFNALFMALASLQIICPSFSSRCARIDMQFLLGMSDKTANVTLSPSYNTEVEPVPPCCNWNTVFEDVGYYGPSTACGTAK